MEEGKRAKNRGTIVDSNEEEMIIKEPIQIENSNPKSILNESDDKPKRKVKAIAKKSKKAEVMSEETKEKQAFELINKMRELYKNDLVLNQQMKPSTDRIANIDEIVSKIIKKELQEVLVKMGILKELKTWLEPLPDNSMPNLKIKRSILDALFNVRVTKEDLLESEIGKIIHFYSKNSKESIEIRKKATQLVKKWKGLVIKEETQQL